MGMTKGGGRGGRDGMRSVPFSCPVVVCVWTKKHEWNIDPRRKNSENRKVGELVIVQTADD